MIKNISTIIIVAISSMFLSQCAEVDTPVILDPSQVVLFDTTYVSSTPFNTFQKNVLLEEFSGVKCTNCPQGNAKTKSLHAENPSRINVVTAHSYFLAAPYSGDLDLRCEDAQALIAVPLGPVPSKPATYINRLKYPSLVNRAVPDIDTWENLVNAELAKTTPVNLELETVFVDEEERKFRYKVTVSFSAAISDVSLGFLLTENYIETQQLDNGVLLEEYEHEYVLRDYITSIFGENITENIVANTVIIKEFEVDLDDYEASADGKTTEPIDWKIENMEIVAFIRNNNDEIIQSTSSEL
jgi:hypothetical protein